MHHEKKERLARLQQYAKRMRRNATPGEEAFWEIVRRRRLRGHRFRRQVVLDPYIVDFYSYALQLVVEIDGPCHSLRRDGDRLRDKNLRCMGLYVFRFDEEEVIENPNKVWKMLLAWYKGREDD